MYLTQLTKECVTGLCAGQVIVNVKSCIQQLVDNAVDASANEIKIRLVDDGATLIEVVDNGRGMLLDDLKLACSRSSTSKIKTFDDIYTNRSTFGFRGEALNALANVCDLTITSRTETMDLAVRMTFDANGDPRGEPIYECRGVGTTVLVENIFSKIPVRRLELHRAAKAQLASILNLLTAYSLSNIRVRFVFITQSNRSPTPKTLLSTSGGEHQSLRSAFTHLFGDALANTMLDVDIKHDGPKQLWRWVSESHGLCSRPCATPDRSKRAAFLFVNGFFVVSGLSKFINALNGLYQDMSTKKCLPQYVLNIEVDREDVDFNITPTKQTVLLGNLYYITQSVVAHLRTRFHSILDGLPRSTLTTATSASVSKQLKPKTQPNAFMDAQDSRKPGLSGLPPIKIVAMLNPNTDSSNAETPLDISTGSNYLESDISVNSSRRSLNNSCTSASDSPPLDTQEHVPFCFMTCNVKEQSSSKGPQFKENHRLTETSKDVKDIAGDCKSEGLSETKTKKDVRQQRPIKHSKVDNMKTPTGLYEEHGDRLKGTLETLHESADEKFEKAVASNKVENTQQWFFLQHIDSEGCEPWTVVNREEYPEIFSLVPCASSVPLDSLSCEPQQRRVPLETLDMDKLSLASTGNLCCSETIIHFPKQCFDEMRVIGQFNKEVFVVDQHATDEKYKYEALCTKAATAHVQPLVVPLRLEVSPVEKQIILDHLHVFRFNGFDIRESLNEPPVSPNDVCLASLSQESNITTNVESLHCSELFMYGVPVHEGQILSSVEVMELVEMIRKEGSPVEKNSLQCCQHFRPHKLKTLFASRACRSAVMIGDELSKTHMSTLVKRMGQMEKPWNCPHGRPTMRHLFSIVDVRSERAGIKVLLNGTKQRFLACLSCEHD